MRMSEFAARLTQMTKSAFHVSKENTSKTSQFWVMNRNDVSYILRNRHRFTLPKRIEDGAADENYFLPLLRLDDPHYSFSNQQPMYVEWLDNVIARHPVTFNRVDNHDLQRMRTTQSFFFRKTTRNVHVGGTQNNTNYLIIYIGTHTNQPAILTHLQKNDFSNYSIILVSMSDKLTLNSWLIDKSYKIYDIIWSQVNQSITALTNKYGPLGGQLYFITEQFLIERLRPATMRYDYTRISNITYTRTRDDQHKEAFGYNNTHKGSQWEKRGGKSNRKYKHTKMARKPTKYTRHKRRRHRNTPKQF
tara:strand:- start:274 stop:1185 length:912 start_codon:yes stop_codon:yes gene_type:complete